MTARGDGSGTGSGTGSGAGPGNSAGTERRLEMLRGGQLPQAHNARTIAALASNPGCARRAVLDAAATRKQELAAHAGFPSPYGESPFARNRGIAFERRLKDEPDKELLTLLREVLDLDIAEAGYTDLNAPGWNAVGASRDPAVRHAHTRQQLTAAPQRRGTMFDHPLLRFRVGGRHAYLEPDLIAFRHDGTFHVVEIKSFAVIDGQADGAKVAAAAIQSAVYVLALRDLVGEHATVADQTVLIAPKDFSLLPAAATLDVRKQIGALERQLSRMDSIDRLLAQVPDDVSFSLDRDERGVPHRHPDDLLRDLRLVAANYAPECLATCEMCYLCRDEASGTTGALGRAVREEAGGIESVARVLRVAYEKDPVPVPEDIAEAAMTLRRAASLRRTALGGLG
jgi:hypothetical protein